MRFFWLLNLAITSLHCQQPPNQKDTSALDKHTEFVGSMDKLRLAYHDLVDVRFTAIKGQLIQKLLEQSKLSTTEYERIIDHENDARISARHATIKDLTLKMEKLETQLAKTEHILCGDIKNILEIDREHAINQQIEGAEKELFDTLMELCYLQTLRRYQNASAIHQALSTTK